MLLETRKTPTGNTARPSVAEQPLELAPRTFPGPCDAPFPIPPLSEHKRKRQVVCVERTYIVYIHIHRNTETPI